MFDKSFLDLFKLTDDNFSTKLKAHSHVIQKYSVFKLLKPYITRCQISTLIDLLVTEKKIPKINFLILFPFMV